MKTLSQVFAILICLARPVFADLKVATSLTDLASVAQFVGGKHVQAFSLCKGYQDPHFVPAKPSLMKWVQDADVFVSVGLELDSGWLPLVLQGSRNPRIQPGAKGFVDASEGVHVLQEPTETLSRAEGDVHPLGNPHYYLDPVNLGLVADHLAKVFSELDPVHSWEYTTNTKTFKDRMAASLKDWTDRLKPYQGRSVVTYHKNFDYFLERFGLKLLGTVEKKPGIPPSPKYLAGMAEAMKGSGSKVVLYGPYHDAGAAKTLAHSAEGVALEVPTEVDGTPEAKDVFAKFETLVSMLAKAL